MAWLLSATMLSGMLPTVVYAEGDGNIYESQQEQSAGTVSGNAASLQTASEQIDTAQNGYIFDKTGIRTVILENGVTAIGDKAFLECTSLRNVDLSSNSSLKEIGLLPFLAVQALF